MTILLVLLSVAYAVAAVVSFAVVIPFEVFLWGGLILIVGWVWHDTRGLVREREAAA